MAVLMLPLRLGMPWIPWKMMHTKMLICLLYQISLCLAYQIACLPVSKNNALLVTDFTH